MGSVVSKVKVLRIAVKQVLALSASYEHLLKRIQTDPGLPVPNPTLSFWHDVPSPLASHRPDALPTYADVVIIGSGITGTSIARTLLRDGESETLRVVMLEAREVCSGATGRNGGHIKPPLYHDYLDLKKNLGSEQAKKLIRFRLMHVHQMQLIASVEDILKECQCREVESFDVYFDVKMFEDAKRLLDAWKQDMPVEARDYISLEGANASEKFRLASDVAGVVYNPAGAIHPYRFVTHVLARLLEDYPNNFCLSTRTPCTSILPPSTSTPYYTILTPHGAIFTPHVVHATNAWCSHLLQPLRTKIFCVRGNMSAQRPGNSLSPSTLDGGRSWVFYDKHIGYDYLTQLPNGENELMFGGGYFQGGDDGLSELGNNDDSSFNPGIAAHLAGSLPILFGEHNWGVETTPAIPPEKEANSRWFNGRVKAFWSGIIGISADRIPWVGRVPTKLSGRLAPPASSTPFLHKTDKFTISSSPLGEDQTDQIEHICREPKTAAPGEWLSAGYSGEGMAHAFMSGRALGLQILGRNEEAASWFPECMGVTEERWKKAHPEDLIEELWG